MKKGEIIIDSKRNSYTLLKRLGLGGQGTVWKVQDNRDKKEYAFKFYKHNKNNIKHNINELIRLGGLKDKNKIPLPTVVLPKILIPGNGDSFGYIMDLIDLKDYTVLPKAWLVDGKYPSCEALCKIFQNMAAFFEALHASNGMCYKDLNEGNIFFNPKTGDIKIIDNDNIGLAKKFTIKGTMKYMAPEVVTKQHDPDERTDNFSFAVFIYRLLVGGFPFDGKYTRMYCEKYGICESDPEAVKNIYGENAIFVWHPTNRKNSIENENDTVSAAQVKNWQKVPRKIQNMLINTFVTNLPISRRAERTSDENWKKAFEELEKNLVVCPYCGRKVFNDTNYCFECGKKLVVNKPKLPLTNNNPLNQPIQSRHTIKIVLLSADEHKKERSLFVKDELKGEDISKHLKNGPFLKVLVNKANRKVGFKNLSNIVWKVTKNDGSKQFCNMGDVLVIENGMKISLIAKQAQINIKEWTW